MRCYPPPTAPIPGLLPSLGGQYNAAGPTKTQARLTGPLGHTLHILRTRQVSRTDRITFWIAILWLIAALCQN